ncbi:MAG: imidazoleglycerol-phosphate dehydratase, partial [Verrucomicrobiae bacterium]|nr:imidazoleglycerol-phosphate dehydratase [Verrucomicrobiae bacterium]
MSQPPRSASLHRKTAETEIRLAATLDGTGVSKIDTGIPFLDHMLTLFAKHSRIDLEIAAKGDLEVDFHHTVEDTG